MSRKRFFCLWTQNVWVRIFFFQMCIKWLLLSILISIKSSLQILFVEILFFITAPTIEGKNSQNKTSNVLIVARGGQISWQSIQTIGNSRKFAGMQGAGTQSVVCNHWYSCPDHSRLPLSDLTYTLISTTSSWWSVWSSLSLLNHYCQLPSQMRRLPPGPEYVIQNSNYSFQSERRDGCLFRKTNHANPSCGNIGSKIQCLSTRAPAWWWPLCGCGGLSEVATGLKAEGERQLSSCLSVTTTKNEVV